MYTAIIYLYIILIACFTIRCNKNPEPETYLIPKGFTGRVDVIFNQKTGVPSKYENGRRIYMIPNNGILLSQFNDEYGIVNRKYYYVDSVNNRSELPVFQYQQNSDGTSSAIVSDSNRVGIFIDGTTGIYGDSLDGRIPYQEFIVANPKNLKKTEPLDSFLARMEKITGFSY